MDLLLLTDSSNNYRLVILELWITSSLSLSVKYNPQQFFVHASFSRMEHWNLGTIILLCHLQKVFRF
jgi:hypothetical protein